MRSGVQQTSKGRKTLQDKVDDFFQLLVGAADHTNEFSSFQSLIVELNRVCDNIFRAAGTVMQAIANVIGGESDPNRQTRGESPHIDHT